MDAAVGPLALRRGVALAMMDSGQSEKRIMLKIKRVYEAPSADDGFRILVDRLWPRGVSKERADLDLWEKDIAPSTEQRHEFHEGDETPEQFAAAYMEELRANPAFPRFTDLVRDKLAQGNVTLLYGSRNTQCNNAIVLKDALDKELASPVS